MGWQIRSTKRKSLLSIWMIDICHRPGQSSLNRCITLSPSSLSLLLYGLKPLGPLICCMAHSNQRHRQRACSLDQPSSTTSI
ncbi:hypothetical protein VTN00DRAFT_6795 [Thermoascus crustaceus]|uniref:uncharacterized protein n=1 Tax=Thermoascus crustaceus TaxID=5088 RepID=UPI003741ED69